jgi:acyl carrier protein
MIQPFGSETPSIDEIRGAIHDHILQECAGVVDPASITDDGSLIDAGLVDSLFVVSILVFIEERFGLRLDPEEVPVLDIETVNDIAALIESELTHRNRNAKS